MIYFKFFRLCSYLWQPTDDIVLPTEYDCNLSDKDKSIINIIIWTKLYINFFESIFLITNDNFIGWKGYNGTTYFYEKVVLRTTRTLIYLKYVQKK